MVDFVLFSLRIVLLASPAVASLQVFTATIAVALTVHGWDTGANSGWATTIA